ncbi:MAG TPA: tetratricopeptide repeat protein [Vicinamibacteria bacterium]|nr:tetratricopeptide repeat protein [Vicinamibacteria bacterium]
MSQATRPEPPKTPEARVTLERDRRLSDSLIWPLQREFYRRRGTSAWTSGELPWYVTSNSFIARAYARMVVGWLRDLLAAGQVDRSRPLYVLELAAGSGHFAFLFLKKLQALRDELPALGEIDLRYVMTDLPEANIAAWQGNERFAPFLESGRLDFALFDLESDSEVRLLRSGAVLSPGAVANPLAVLANYAFDSTRQDLFFVKEGALHEGLVTTLSSQDEPDLADPRALGRLTTRYSQRPAPERYYGEPALDALLHEYRDRLGDTAVLVPIGAIRCLDNLARLSGGRLLLVSADKGVTGFEEIVRQEEPHRVRHGDCFSMDVNFHALGRYVEAQGGHALFPLRDRNLKTTAFLLGGPAEAFAESRLAFRESLASFSPIDYHRLSSGIRKDYAEPPLEFILSLLKLGDWDYQFLVRYAPVIAREATKAGEGVKWELRRALDAVWDNFYPMGVDVAFEIGRILAAMHVPLDALRYYKESLRIAGPHHATFYNMGLCLYYLQQPAEALRFMDRSLALKPDYARAREWRNRLRAETGG